MPLGFSSFSFSPGMYFCAWSFLSNSGRSARVVWGSEFLFLVHNLSVSAVTPQVKASDAMPIPMKSLYMYPFLCILVLKLKNEKWVPSLKTVSLVSWNNFGVFVKEDRIKCSFDSQSSELIQVKRMINSADKGELGISFNGGKDCTVVLYLYILTLAAL